MRKVGKNGEKIPIHFNFLFKLKSKGRITHNALRTKSHFFGSNMAATEMYKVKPIHENTSIADALPQTMYKMINFHKVPAAEMVCFFRKF